jgi:hypothetical protein
MELTIAAKDTEVHRFKLELDSLLHAARALQQ